MAHKSNAKVIKGLKEKLYKQISDNVDLKDMLTLACCYCNNLERLLRQMGISRRTIEEIKRDGIDRL